MKTREEMTITWTSRHITSIRVDKLPAMMDEIYLFSCFHDNAEVLAATVLRDPRTQVPLDFGFVQFTSHTDAEFVLESYNGQRMPNSNHARYCLSWDTDGFGTKWRWDPVYHKCSFFGYDKYAKKIDAKTVIQSIIKSTKKRSLPPPRSAYSNTWRESRLRLVGSSPPEYMEIDGDKRLKLKDMPLTHPQTYQQGYACPSITILQNLPDPMQLDNDCGAAYVNDQQLTQIPMGVSSLEKEKELYLCFEEVDFRRACYVFRTIKLSDLLNCSCHFSIKSREIIKCEHCTRKTKQESQLRQRAWLVAGEKVPESCGGEEATIPVSMSCCNHGSQMIFAGGFVPRDANEPGSVPGGDVYSFHRESTVWQKLDWTFPKVTPIPLLLEVNGKLYCLSNRPLEHYPTSSECLVLPDPQVNLPGLDNCHCLVKHGSFNELACAVVGSKILISSTGEYIRAPYCPIICFDVNDKDQKWRGMTSLYDGKPFPFNGRALVLDLNGIHVMFSFCHGSVICVSRLAVNDENGDISVSDEESLGGPHLLHAYMRDCYKLSSTFVDLKDQNKVACVVCGSMYSGKNPIGRVRVLVMVVHYEVWGPKYVRSEIAATRTFEYNCHSTIIGKTNVTGGFVVV